MNFIPSPDCCQTFVILAIYLSLVSASLTTLYMFLSIHFLVDLRKELLKIKHPHSCDGAHWTCDVDGLTCVTAHPCQEKCKTAFAVRSSLVPSLSVINEAALSHVYPLNRGSCCFLILQVCNKLRRKTSANSWKQEGKRHLPLV